MEPLFTVLGIVAIGAIVAGVIQSFASVWVAQSQRRSERLERAAARDYELEVQRLQDQRRLRDARLERLRKDARELTMGLFDLQRAMLLLQWGREHRRAEREDLEATARRRYEKARAGLALDPDGAQLERAFVRLTEEIAHYESMLESQRALVEARIGDQAIDHAGKIEEQRNLVLEDIDRTIRQVGDVLNEIALGEPVDRPRTTSARALPPIP